jgi:TolB-like protein/class 3 adenylate cyclase/Flp pilus assembly protein TadD
MADEGFKRKLAAILSADVEGYSRLMDDDEEATVHTLTSYRTAITDLVQQYRGRVVDSPGDNILAEFASVVDAVNCAVEIQRDLAERNAELAYNRQMQFRIGVNLGDVIDQDGRIYGDGVNIAARVESLAEAGGICISGRAHDQVENKLGLEYEDLGKHEVKNITRPIQVYRVLSYPGAAAHRVVQAKESLGRKWHKIAIAAAIVIAVIGGFAYWQFYIRRPTVEPASIERMTFPLPDKPSIAVLHFVNMSGDPEQEYFSDGMTEDLITDLSQISGLFVIGRNSTFTYKGKPVKIRQVAEELGVRYVLEGSVRKAENMVRINAQLIDATTGGHLWAERYDGQTDNVFSLQDKITQKIVEALAVKLTIDEKDAIPKKETENLEAYLIFLKGWQHYRRFSPDAFLEAIPPFEKAIELDPNYWRAYAALAKIYWETLERPMWCRRLGVTQGEAVRRAYKYLDLAMKGPTALAHEVATEMHVRGGGFDKAIAEATRAVSLNPNDPDANFAMGYALTWAGRHKEAVESYNRAMRLDPFYQDTYGYMLGFSYFHIFQFEKAATLCERSFKSNPENAFPLWYLAASYAHLGRLQEAEIALAKLKEVKPYTSNFINFPFGYKDPAELYILNFSYLKEICNKSSIPILQITPTNRYFWNS